MKLAATAFAAVISAAALSSPASAATRIGTLDCNVGAGVGMVITSSRALNCVYRSDRGATERYVGTVRRFGLDLGVTGAGKLGWAVFADTRPGAGALSGNYTGASGAITAGIGVGANALVGGNGQQFTLQPLSVEAQTGISIAAGVGDLQLESVRATRPVSRRRHR